MRAMQQRKHLRRTRNRRGIGRNLILAVVGSLVLASFTVLGIYVYSSAKSNPSEELDTAFRFLRKGDADLSAKIARSIDPERISKRSDLSKREFLLGAHERVNAQKTVQRRIATELNEQAVKHLERSRELSFPEGYEGQGNYLLGMAFYDLFRWDEAEPVLEIASERWPQGRADSIERLIDIELSFENKDPDAAMQRVEHWKSLPKSSLDEVDRTVVKEMQVLHAAGKFDAASQLLDRVPEDSLYRPMAELAYGRSLVQLASSADEPLRIEYLNRAGQSFEKVLEIAKAPIPVRRQCNLELGRVQRSLGNITQAVSTFSSLRLASPHEAVFLLSGIEEIDCLIALGRTHDVIDTLRHLSNNFGEMIWYQNESMPISEMRKRLIAAGEQLIALGANEEAIDFSSLLPPICDELDRLRIDCRGYEALANQVNKQYSPGLAEQLFRKSADAYARLATKLMRSPNYSDLMMKAIANYRNAGAFGESNRMLDQFLKFEPRENQPVGLLIKAKNYNSLNQSDLAMKSLERIIDSNINTSLVYEARLEAAKLLASKDNFQEAEELIVQNLYFGDLKPESPVWKDSLFELGELSFRRGEKLQSQAMNAIVESPSNAYENLAKMEASFKELLLSIDRIKDGLRRFKEDPRRLKMLYTIAKAYQMASAWPEMLLKENRLANEETVAGWKAQRKDLLNSSREAYRTLRQEIIAAADMNKTAPNADKFLRNSFFGEADLLFEAGEYEEALAAYRDVSNRFINEPESIESTVQIANCFKELGKLNDCRRNLELAKEMLQRIPAEKESRFSQVTSHDRAGWETYLDWLLANASRR
jgi:tetratricopeptide (TPR) repeat protein